LCFAQSDPRQVVAMALLSDGTAKWQYPLPPGVPSTQVEAIAWGRVVGDAAHWIVAAPDGSIHFLAPGGEILDRFNLGAIPTGMTPATIDGNAALVVATKEGTIEALRFEPTETIRPAE
jgi:hypothetical protein